MGVMMTTRLQSGGGGACGSRVATAIGDALPAPPSLNGGAMHLRGGSRGAPSVGQDVGSPPATPYNRDAWRAAVGCVANRAPADPSGRHLPRGRGGGTGGAVAAALASGGGAPQSPPGLGELRRPPGFADRGLDLFVLAVHGADVLAKDEGG